MPSTPQAHAKIADFGLAKVADMAGPSTDLMDIVNQLQDSLHAPPTPQPPTKSNGVANGNHSHDVHASPASMKVQV